MDKVQDKREWHLTIIDNAVLFSSKLTIYEKMVYSILGAYANSKTGECFPSVKTIARLSGISDNTARKALKGLEEKKLITIENRKTGEFNSSNLYTLVDLPQWILDEYQGNKASCEAKDEAEKPNCVQEGTSSDEGGTSRHEVGVLHQVKGVPHHVQGGTSPGEDELEPFNYNQLTSSCSCCHGEDYVNKALSYYCSKGKIPDVNIKPKDIEITEKLIRDIPFKTIITGIDEAFKNYRPKFDGDKINSMAYCEPIIRNMHEKEKAKEAYHGTTCVNNKQNNGNRKVRYSFKKYGGS